MLLSFLFLLHASNTVRDGRSIEAQIECVPFLWVVYKIYVTYIKHIQFTMKFY